MDIARLADMRKDGENSVLTGTCHDCGGPVKVVSEQAADKKTRMSGGAVYETSCGVFFKCDSCFARESRLSNYQPCEVYSRIVGYLRPVGQWNRGKQCEFEQRKTLAV